jgi:hypothetical protein
MDVMSTGANIFRKSRIQLRTAGVRTLTLSKFRTEYKKKIFGAVLKSFVVQATWPPGFVHPW